MNRRGLFKTLFGGLLAGLAVRRGTKPGTMVIYDEAAPVPPQLFDTWKEVPVDPHAVNIEIKVDTKKFDAAIQRASEQIAKDLQQHIERNREAMVKRLMHSPDRIAYFRTRPPVA